MCPITLPFVGEKNCALKKKSITYHSTAMMGTEDFLKLII